MATRPKLPKLPMVVTVPKGSTMITGARAKLWQSFADFIAKADAGFIASPDFSWFKAHEDAYRAVIEQVNEWIETDAEPTAVAKELFYLGVAKLEANFAIWTFDETMRIMEYVERLYAKAKAVESGKPSGVAQFLIGVKMG